MLNALVVFGTRPEAIKLAPLIHALKVNPKTTVQVCFSGQHRELVVPCLDLFDITPDYNLDVMQPDQSLSELSARLILRLERVFATRRPDVVLVQGDTTTAFVASLAAFYQHIPVGHVEAGLRSQDKYNPFPEEINRRLTDRLSDFLFAPTQRAQQFLLNEGVLPETIFVTGNTGIDALNWVVAHLPTQPDPQWQLPDWDQNRRLVLVTGHRRESFGSGLKGICQGLKSIVQRYDNVEIVYPVHLNPNVRETVMHLLKDQPRLHLIAPLDYVPFVFLMKHAHLILTDSGGVQEEAPTLGKPVLVLRSVTERPEGIEAGTAKLVGTDAKAIMQAVSQLLEDPLTYQQMAHAVNPYGDGKAAQRIVKHLLDNEGAFG